MGKDACGAKNLRCVVFQDELFWDEKGGGYFGTAVGDPSILLRMKEEYDGAEPSGNSIAAANLLRLSAVLDGEQGEELRRRAEHTLVIGHCHLGRNR